MFIYNKTVFSFITKANSLLKEIIQNEAKISVNRSRFIHKNYYYPIKIVIFQGTNKIGYFDPKTYEIGLNEHLLYETRLHILKDILRHEFAHYLNFIENPSHEKAHGIEYQSICQRFNWEKSVSKASAKIEDLKSEKVANLEDEKVLEKVKKLLKLAQSANANESELATLKANQLLIKHNLTFYSNFSDQDLFVKRIHNSKKRNSKITLMYDILKHFNVNPILRYHKEGVFLEVCSQRINIELAEYISSFLDKKLEELWIEHKTTNSLKGLKAKNSFFHGIGKGYDEKFNKSLTKEDKKSLILLKEQNDFAMRKIYSRLSSTSSNSSIDKDAYSKGLEAGKNLTINSALKNNVKKKFQLGY